MTSTASASTAATDRDLIHTFLREMYQDGMGLAYIGSQPVDGTFSETSFEWPAEADKMVRAIVQADAVGDVWFSTNLMRYNGIGRKIGNSVDNRPHLHADIDRALTAEDMAKLDTLDAMIVNSGTPGHVHVYVSLDDVVDAASYHTLEDRLAAYLGADAKVRDNDILRIPGTRNHKTDPPNPVSWPKRNAQPWNPSDLDAMLPAKPESAPPAPVCGPVAAEPVSQLPLAVQKALAGVSADDRSGSTFAVLKDCARAGLTEGQARTVVLGVEILAERWRRDGGDLLAANEIAKAYAQVAADPAVVAAAEWAEFEAAFYEQEGAEPMTTTPSTTVPSTPATRARVRTVSEMAPATRLEWLAAERIPRAKVTLLVGEEGAGKSLFWIWLVSALTNGRAAPEFGIEAGPRRKVALIVNADGWSDTVLPRLVVAGVDLDMVVVVSIDADGEGSPVLPDDVDILPPDVDLVIVDEWLSTLPPGKSIKDPLVARELLKPLQAWCGRNDVAMLLVTHTNRMNTGSARDAYANTSELRKVGRSALLLAKDREVANGFTVGAEKANLSGKGNASRFTTTSAQFDIGGVQGDTGVCVYESESDKTASELFASARAADDEADGTKRPPAKVWVVQYLIDHNGSAEANVIKEAGRQMWNFSERALLNAANNVGCDIAKSKAENGKWVWTLPLNF